MRTLTKLHIGTLFSLPLSSHRYFVLIYIIDHIEVLLMRTLTKLHIGTLFSLPLSSHRYFVLIYIIDHTEVLLQTYDFDFDLRFRGNPGRSGSPDLAPKGVRVHTWGTDSTCASHVSE